MNGTGSRHRLGIFIDGSNAIDLSGKLQLMEEEVETENYCLAETFETYGWKPLRHIGGEEYGRDSFDGPVALSCDQCKDQVCWVALLTLW